MAARKLQVREQPTLADGRLVLAFSGWMDGGDVSTGTVEYLIKALQARPVAEIDPEGFYIYNFPGPMEISSLFRPHTSIEDGVVTGYQPPENTFFHSASPPLLLFRGKEPNFNWRDFADCIFAFAAQAQVAALYFVGSFGGTVPHTREPRLWCAVSDPRMRASLKDYGVGFTTYEGPASFATHLLYHAKKRGVQMASFVAEIPAYVQGTNPKSIEVVVRKLSALLGLSLDLGELRSLGVAWEERLNEALEKKPELARHIRRLEEDYDNEVFDTQMGDLKEWLEKQGVRVD